MRISDWSSDVCSSDLCSRRSPPRTARRSAEGEAYARELGERARFVRHDVTDEDGWRMVTEEILEREGRLDILVNNAGIGNAPHPSTPDVGLLDDWRQMLRVNGEGTFLGCKYGIAAMLS